MSHHYFYDGSDGRSLIGMQPVLSGVRLGIAREDDPDFTDELQLTLTIEDCRSLLDNASAVIAAAEELSTATGRE